MLKDVDRPEGLIGSVAELEAQEVPRIRQATAAELDRECGAVVGCNGGSGRFRHGDNGEYVRMAASSG